MIILGKRETPFQPARKIIYRIDNLPVTETVMAGGGDV